jgi:hypothetical protein
MPSLDRTSVVVPKLNAAVHFARAAGLNGTGAGPRTSAGSRPTSEDSTMSVAQAFGARVHIISRK